MFAAFPFISSVFLAFSASRCLFPLKIKKYCEKFVQVLRWPQFLYFFCSLESYLLPWLLTLLTPSCFSIWPQQVLKALLFINITFLILLCSFDLFFFNFSVSDLLLLCDYHYTLNDFRCILNIRDRKCKFSPKISSLLVIRPPNLLRHMALKTP